MDPALRRVILGGLAGLGVACGGAEVEPGCTEANLRCETDAGVRPRPDPLALPYATELVDFAPGAGAGFGQSELPHVVLGPPFVAEGGGGSLDVLSLGVGGEIILGFAPRVIVDGPGDDFVVFENPFYVLGNPEEPYAELGEVSVSTDAVTWHTFPCDTAGAGRGRWPGCAGWRPTRFYDPESLIPLVPEQTGGDPFDLAGLGLTEARYVRIRDLAEEGTPPSAGFDLDAVGVVHFREE